MLDGVLICMVSFVRDMVPLLCLPFSPRRSALVYLGKMIVNARVVECEDLINDLLLRPGLRDRSLPRDMILGGLGLKLCCYYLRIVIGSSAG